MHCNIHIIAFDIKAYIFGYVNYYEYYRKTLRFLFLYALTIEIFRSDGQLNEMQF